MTVIEEYPGHLPKTAPRPERDRHVPLIRIALVFSFITFLYIVVQQSPPNPAASSLSDHKGGFASNSDSSVETRHLSGKVRSGSTLFGALIEKGVTREVANNVIGEISKSFDVRRVRSGDEFEIVTSADRDLISFNYFADPLNVYYVERGDDGIVSGKRKYALDTVESLVHGEVENTVYQAILAYGEGAQLAGLFVNIFAWDFDFTTSTRKGDRFTILVEKNFKDDEFYGYGKILAAQYESSFGAVQSVYYKAPDGEEGYYSPEGRSMRKAFLRSPLRYDYITSGFSNWRFHPILKRRAPHYAIDYGARTGTPVWAVGDGRVIYSGWKGPAGKTVVIRHPNQYVTSYSHLSRIARGVQVGATVKQKQVIGHVGSTGLATGPHLHYMLKIGGRYVNPQRVKFPPGRPVAAKYFKEFEELQGRLQARLDKAPQMATIARASGPQH